MQNGGDITLKSLRKLYKVSPELVWNILEYLHEAPLYEAITAGENDFLLVHSGINSFEKEKKLSQYTADDFLWARPRLKDEYFDDIMTVFGHTPTMSYGDTYRGKIIRTKTWIDIDVGVAYGQNPVLLCLDTLKELYAD